MVKQLKEMKDCDRELQKLLKKLGNKFDDGGAVERMQRQLNALDKKVNG